MIPGKKYKPEDYLEIVWRRRWVIVVPLVLAAIGTFVWARTLPDRYKSDALILVVPPQVSPKVIAPTTTQSLSLRLSAMREQILSRPRLEAIINEFDLYPQERREQLMDDVVATMRKAISVAPGRALRRQEPNTINVSFEADNPRTAQVVTDRLASLFIRENLETRAAQAGTQAGFFDSQLDELRRRLQDQESHLAQFQRENGATPGESNSVFQLVQSGQSQVQNISDAIAKDREHQLVVDRTITDEGAIAAASSPSVSSGGKEAQPQNAAQALEIAKAQLGQMELRLKPEHPDIRAQKRHIAELEAKAADEASQAPVSSGGAPGVGMSSAEAARQKRLATLRNDMDATTRRIAGREQELSRAQAQLASYRDKLAAAPALQGQQQQLMRDYETTKESYNALLRKSEEAKLSANMEERQVSEQFRLVDSARAPSKPTSPDRLRLNLMGLGGGLAFGLLIAGLLEYRDTSLRTEEDIIVALSLPVIAIVPSMTTALDRKRSVRLRRLVGSAVGLTLVVSAIAIVWKLRLVELWVR